MRSGFSENSIKSSPVSLWDLGPMPRSPVIAAFPKSGHRRNGLANRSQQRLVVEGLEEKRARSARQRGGSVGGIIFTSHDNGARARGNRAQLGQDFETRHP